MTEEQYNNTQDNTWIMHNKARAFFESSPKKQGWIMDGEFKGNCWEPGNQDEIVFGLMNDYDKDFLSHYGYSKFGDFVNPPIELAPYGEAWQIDYTPVDTEHTKFLQIQDQRLPEMIMADASEFDALWDAFVAEIGPSAQAFGEIARQLVRMDFLGAAPYGELDLIGALIVCDNDVNVLRLHREIAYDSEDARIACL
jgi:putative aldouronate transport system substrate-binding protein